MNTSETPAVRHYALPGLYNLRDIGGFPAATGQTRWGVLFRSDALHRLDESGWAVLTELGLAHVLDLRGHEELASAPNQLDGVDVQTHHIPIFDEAATVTQISTQRGLAGIYDHMIHTCGPQVAAAIRVIATAGPDEPVLVHCTAGKDRTGIVIALSLLAAGVDREAVVADYAATAQYLQGEWADAMLATFGSAPDPPADLVDIVTTSPAPVLDELISRIEAEYESIRAYLRHLGLTDDELDRLTVRTIETS